MVIKIENCIYNNMFIGIGIRKTFEKSKIFRYRHMNKKKYNERKNFVQDQYDYTVPTSINNTQSEPCRQLFAEAVYNWKSVLTPEEKNIFRKNNFQLSGYNYYIQQYIKSNFSGS